MRIRRPPLEENGREYQYLNKPYPHRSIEEVDKSIESDLLSISLFRI
ncbi:hypothetical protein SH467x_004162 [Pirellulaceae bacterium SH467]